MALLPSGVGRQILALDVVAERLEQGARFAWAVNTLLTAKCWIKFDILEAGASGFSVGALAPLDASSSGLSTNSRLPGLHRA